MKKQSKIKKVILILLGIISALLLVVFYGDIRSTVAQSIRIMNNRKIRTENAEKYIDGVFIWDSANQEAGTEKLVKESYCMWQSYNFGEAVNKATTIVRGKVVSRSTETKGLPIIYNQDGSIYEYDYFRELTVEVVEMIKGDKTQETVIYKEPGGETDKYIYKFSDVEPLNIGQEYIFFLEENNAFLSPLSVIAISEGSVKVSSEFLTKNLIKKRANGGEISVDDYIKAVKGTLWGVRIIKVLVRVALAGVFILICYFICRKLVKKKRGKMLRIEECDTKLGAEG